MPASGAPGLGLTPVLALAAGLALGCGDGGVTLPALEIRTTTTGTELDPDGYTVTVDNAPAQPIGLVDTLVVDPLSEGEHSVTLAGLAANCRVNGGTTVTATVTRTATAVVVFGVVCGATHGQVIVSTASSGEPPDPDGYVLKLDDTTVGPIGDEDTVTVRGVPPGDHRVTLEGVADNCTVAGDNPRAVTVAAGADAAVRFEVSCVGKSQVIAFSASAPGLLGVFVVSPDGSGLTDLTPDGVFERDPVWSPDGSRLLFVQMAPSFQSEALMVMSGEGSDRTQLASAEMMIDYRWSRDGARIAFSKGRIEQGEVRSDLWIMRADGSGKVKLASDAESPAWSPDGTRIAYVHDVDELHIRIIGSDGSNDQRLTDASLSAIQPAWSPDGSRIAFTSLDPNEIRVINPDGTGLLNLTNGVAQEDGPVWSPDGSLIAFNTGPESDLLESDVALVRPDGSGRVNLTNRPGFDLSPDWSPDGRRIVFVRGDNSDNEIYVMNRDGSNPTNISHRPDSFESAPDWGGRAQMSPMASAGPLAKLRLMRWEAVRR